MKAYSILFALACMAVCVGCGKGEGVTPLMKAAHSGDTEKLTDLISSEGVDLNETSRYGWTALMFASWRGHTDCVEKLLSEGADPNILSGKVPSSFDTVLGHPPTTALREAIRSRHFEIVDILLDNGADIDAKAFALAAETGEIPLVERFLKIGAKVNPLSQEVSTLRLASSAGNLDMVQWLITHGADPNLISQGQTALQEAVRANHVDTVKYLLENGADPNLVFGSTKDTVLITAVTEHTDYRKYKENLSIIKLLLSHGANKNYRGYGNKTAFEKLRIQRANYLKSDKKITDSRIRKRHDDSLRHIEAKIALLEK